MKIWSHTLVKNEESFVWFALMSVVDFVDKMLVWDTGSTDHTVALIKDVMSRKPGKIEFKECGQVNAVEFTKLRQAMIDQSDCDWIMVLDGDEVWWKESIRKALSLIEQKKSKLNGIYVPMKVSVGDVFHLQDEDAGRYRIGKQTGHLNLRFMNSQIQGLHADLPFGSEGYFDFQNRPIQQLEKVEYLDAPYLHLTHLKRSSVDRMDKKRKFEIGQRVPSDYNFPEVFLLDFPDFVPNPFQRRGWQYSARAITELPLRRIKRRWLKQ